jgi:hypothetical protein
MNMSLVENAANGLAHFLYSGLQQKLEPSRLARAGYALLASGCSVKGDFPGDNLASYLVATQWGDGGWADVEETLWCLGYLNALGERYRAEIVNGHKWLASVQLPCGAWGKSSRDQPRIPVTTLASVFTPELVNTAALKWLANQWEADMDSPTQLTYKGAFYLLTQAHSQASFAQELTDRTISYLSGEQEDDGGFGPWKGHPAGSDPWSTGVVLWGLSRVGELIPRHTVERALSWLESRQLPNGLWPYHYLDDGSAMALIGISSVLPLFLE